MSALSASDRDPCLISPADLENLETDFSIEDIIAGLQVEQSSLEKEVEGDLQLPPIDDLANLSDLLPPPNETQSEPSKASSDVPNRETVEAYLDQAEAELVPAPAPAPSSAQKITLLTDSDFESGPDLEVIPNLFDSSDSDDEPENKGYPSPLPDHSSDADLPTMESDSSSAPTSPVPRLSRARKARASSRARGYIKRGSGFCTHLDKFPRSSTSLSPVAKLLRNTNLFSPLDVRPSKQLSNRKMFLEIPAGYKIDLDNTLIWNWRGIFAEKHPVRYDSMGDLVEEWKILRVFVNQTGVRNATPHTIRVAGVLADVPYINKASKSLVVTPKSFDMYLSFGYCRTVNPWYTLNQAIFHFLGEEAKEVRAVFDTVA